MESMKKDKTLFKTIVLDHLPKWMQEKPEVRSQKYISLKCPSISQSKLSRILDSKSTTCPSFEETVELMMFIKRPEAIDRFLRASDSQLSYHLKSLKDTKGIKFDEQLKVTNDENTISDINDNLALIRQELTWRARKIDLAKGILGGIAISWFVVIAWDSFLNIYSILTGELNR